MDEQTKLREFLRKHALLYETTVPEPTYLIGWARDPADRADGCQRARVYFSELQDTRKYDSNRATIHIRLNKYIAAGERLTKEMFRQCRVFTSIYELKAGSIRLFLFKWRCVWFLASGMDKNPNDRVVKSEMKRADRIRKNMEAWLNEHAPKRPVPRNPS